MNSAWPTLHDKTMWQGCDCVDNTNNEQRVSHARGCYYMRCDAVRSDAMARCEAARRLTLRTTSIISPPPPPSGTLPSVSVLPRSALLPPPPPPPSPAAAAARIACASMTRMCAAPDHPAARATFFHKLSARVRFCASSSMDARSSGCVSMQFCARSGKRESVVAFKAGKCERGE